MTLVASQIGPERGALVTAPVTEPREGPVSGFVTEFFSRPEPVIGPGPTP